MPAAGENHWTYQDPQYPRSGQRCHYYSIQLAVGIGILVPTHRVGSELRQRKGEMKELKKTCPACREQDNQRPFNSCPEVAPLSTVP